MSTAIWNSREKYIFNHIPYQRNFSLGMRWSLLLGIRNDISELCVGCRKNNIFRPKIKAKLSNNLANSFNWTILLPSSACISFDLLPAIYFFSIELNENRENFIYKRLSWSIKRSSSLIAACGIIFVVQFC